MAAPRAYWKGYLKLSLVTCPVALYPASSQSEKTRFHQINRKTGNRLRQQMVDEKTGRVVEGDNKGRGYELKRGSYVEIEPEELEAVEVESTRAIDIDKFVPENEIDKRYYERPYYIVPDDKSGEEAFAVIRDAMKDKGRVALALASYSPTGSTLLQSSRGAKACSAPHSIMTRSGDEKNFFKQIPSLRVPQDMVELAGHILNRKAGHFDAGKFKDEYELALRKVVKRKAAGHTVEPRPEEPAPSNVINLMDALRESMKRKKAPNSSRSTNRRNAGQKKTARRKAG